MFYRINDRLSAQKMKEMIAAGRGNERYVPEWSDAYSVEMRLGDCEYCPVCGAPASHLEWLPPLKMRLTNTRYPNRLIHWLSQPMVISQEVKDAYEAEGLTGITEFEPIEITSVANRKTVSKIPPKYYRAKIGRTQIVRVDSVTTIIDGRPHDHFCQLCDPLGRTIDCIRQVGLIIPKQMDTDIFRIYGWGMAVIVSQRFYDMVQRNHFTNFYFTPIEYVNGVRADGEA